MRPVGVGYIPFTNTIHKQLFGSPFLPYSKDLKKNFVSRPMLFYRELSICEFWSSYVYSERRYRRFISLGIYPTPIGRIPYSYWTYTLLVLDEYSTHCVHTVFVLSSYCIRTRRVQTLLPNSH